MQNKLSQYMRVDTNSHSDSEGSTSGIGTATDNAYHILPASDSPVSSCPFSSSTTTSLVYGNGEFVQFAVWQTIKTHAKLILTGKTINCYSIHIVYNRYIIFKEFQWRKQWR